MTERNEFAEFVQQHTPALLRSAYLLTGNRAAAEDLVQDTFVRLYPRWDRVAGADVPIAYVRRSMTNNFLNLRRGRAGRELLFADPPQAADSPDPATGVSERDLVRGLLDGLPPRPRAVLVLRFFHDLTDAEIAADLGCRQGTVRSIVSRALATLRVDAARAGRADATTTDGTLR